MSRAEDWQELFRKNGWWDGETITSPRGSSLGIWIKSGPLLMINTDMKDLEPSKNDLALGYVKGEGPILFSVAADHEFITLVRSYQGNKSTSFHKWEDIYRVHVTDA